VLPITQLPFLSERKAFHQIKLEIGTSSSGKSVHTKRCSASTIVRTRPGYRRA